jgi:nucleoside-diphosphate-sugar epimerase
VTTAFVTGGSGFIGGRLVQRLVADGHRVRALARSDRSAEKVAALGAEPVRGDLDDAGSLRAGAAGCELAFHAAAELGEGKPREFFYRTNVEGTRRVLGASREAGVRRFVHVSTEAVLIAGKPLVHVDETAPRRPDSPAAYPSTKALAEEEVLTANAGGFETVIVRPRFVWGKGDTTLLPNIEMLVRTGRFAWIGGGRQLTDITHVDNVCEGLVVGADRGRPGAIYFVTDGEPVVFREFVGELLATRGVEPPTRNVPAPVAGALAATLETAWRLLPLPGRPPLTRFAVWVASQECTIDITRARNELGYKPIISRQDGLAQMREETTAASV